MRKHNQYHTPQYVLVFQNISCRGRNWLSLAELQITRPYEYNTILVKR